MTASLLTPAQTSALATLPPLSARVLRSLLVSLYAEPGYSFTKAADIAKDLDVPVSKVKGALSSLVQKELAEVVEMEADNEVHALIYSDLHRDRDGKDGDAIRAEALKLIEARLTAGDCSCGAGTHFSGPCPTSPMGERLARIEAEVSPVVEAVKDAVATSDMELEDLAMIAIFGRKAGLGWPVIVQAMGKPLHFTHRLRPVMKKLDATSVAKMGPSYSVEAR